MKNYYIFSEKTGMAVLDDDGRPLTWWDLMANLARWARTQGLRLEISKTGEGEDMFRVVRDDDDSQDN